MSKSATDIMQEIMFSATIEAIQALKAASKGLPNSLLRDLNAIHANSTFQDLPAELQAAITSNVRAAFTRLLREGYTISSSAAPPPQAPAARPDSGPRGRFARPPGRDPGRSRRDGPGQARPDRKPKPKGPPRSR